MSNKPMTAEELDGMTLNDLYDVAKSKGIKNYRKLKKNEIIDEILDLERVLHRKVSISVASAPKIKGEPEKRDLSMPFGEGDEGEPDTGRDRGKLVPEGGPARRSFEPVSMSKPAPLPDPAEYEDDEFGEEAESDFVEPQQPRPMVRREVAPPVVKREPAPPVVKREPPPPAEKREPAGEYRAEKQPAEPSRSFGPHDFEEEEDVVVEPPVSKDFGSREKTPERVPVYDDIDSEMAEDEPRRESAPSRGRPARDQKPAAARGSQRAATGGDGEIQKGVLDIHPDGTYGFIRQKEFRYGEEDIYVSISQIKKFGLLSCDVVEGTVRAPRDQERYKSLVKIERINNGYPDGYRIPLPFEKLVPIYPEQRIFLETDQFETSTRLLDLFSPIGRGQRGIIVAKPKAGKTVLLKKIAASVARNHPEIDLIALLIDERPEEVTDFERNVKGMVISSTFDEKPESHIQTAELAIEYAKRRVEQGKDVMILLDSLTRLARAYNLTCPASGKTLTGGLDPNSLHKPKRFLGAARNIEGGGSLTILSSALIETGSRLDDIIYEEFKGTANSEIHLVRELADKRIFPAIDLIKSGTRHEELLYNPDEMDCLWQLRKMISEMDETERMNRLIGKLIKTKTNVELLLQVQKAVDSGGY